MEHLTMEDDYWLSPEQQEEAVWNIWRFDAYTYDPLGELPLKEEGTYTDLYVRLRDMRGKPAATHYFATLYAQALDQLRIQRFAEIPHGISGIAGHLSVLAGLGYFTIREEEKPGRAAADSKIISDYERGDRIVILDDVINNGRSKVDPVRQCLARGIEVLAIVVLVDREEGWQQTFEAEGISIPVWAGMKLSYVRRELLALGVT